MKLNNEIFGCTGYDSQSVIKNYAVVFGNLVCIELT